MEKITAKFDKDSRKFHRFIIEANQEGIVGMVYFPRDDKKGIPDEITVVLKTSGVEYGSPKN